MYFKMYVDNFFTLNLLFTRRFVLNTAEAKRGNSFPTIEEFLGIVVKFNYTMYTVTSKWIKMFCDKSNIDLNPRYN